MNTKLKATLAASLLSLTAPMAAFSQTTAPVDVQSASFSAPFTGGPAEGTILIKFENEDDSAAKAIVFHLTDATGAQTLVYDAGTFAKGVLVEHAFQSPTIHGGVQAEVVGVQFADGSTWESGMPIPVRSQANANVDLGTPANNDSPF